MALSTLTLNGDGTTTGWTRSSGSGTWASHVEAIADTDNDSSYVLSPDASSGTIWMALTSVPADFVPGAINSITIRVRHRRINTPAMAVDSGTITARIVRTDELTAISTTPTAVNSPISGSYTQTDFAPTPTGSHSIADWDAAKIEIAFTHTSNQTTDTQNVMRVTSAEIEVDYTPVMPAPLIRRWIMQYGRM